MKQKMQNIGTEKMENKNGKKRIMSISVDA